MGKCALAVGLLLLSGCAAQERLVYAPTEVKIPVPVPCSAKVEKPHFPPITIDSLYHAVQTLISELEMRKAYEQELELALAHCTKPI